MFNKKHFWFFALLSSITFFSFSDSTYARSRNAAILKKEIKIDRLVLKTEQDYNRTLIGIRTADNKTKADQQRKQAAKTGQRLKDLYQKRRDFIANQINSADIKKLAVFNEIVLSVFLYEFRVRRAGGYAERSWTRAEKRDRKRCPDIVTDGVLNQWALGLAEAKPNLYANSLSRIVQGMECYSMAEALSFSRDLVRAYLGTLDQFGHNKEFLSRARSYLLSSTANLFIIVQDITKAFGPNPMYEFIRDNRLALGNVFMDRYSPIHAAGFWLYDMKLDRMVAVGPLCESLSGKKNIQSNKNCVSATATLDALIDPNRIGLASCLLTDMISPVFDVKLGYLCQRDVCSETSENKPALQQALNNKKTPYALPLDSLNSSRNCPERSDGGGSSEGMNGLLGETQSFMECVTETLLAEQKGRRACFVEVANQARASRFGFAPAPMENDNCSDPLSQGQRGDKKIQEKINKALIKAFEGFTEEQEETLGLYYEGNKLTDDENQCEKVCRIQDENGNNNLIFNRRFVKQASDDELAGETRFVLSQILAEVTPEQPEPPSLEPIPVPSDPDEEDDDDFFCWAWEDNCPPSESGNESGDEYCHPDVADCSNCSALSGVQKAMLDCFSTNDEAIPSRPGLPEQIMPLPWDDLNSPAWAACLKKQEGPGDSLACSNIDCGEGKEPSIDDNGECVCRSPSVPIGREPDPIDCPQGTFPVVGPGGVPLCNATGSDGLSPAN